MSKLIYPEDGIYKYCDISLHDGIESLIRAKSDSNFDIPYGFSYSNTLNGLDLVLKKYVNEAKIIKEKIIKTNDNYDTLSDNLEMETKKIICPKIIERDQMIL